jgi:transposase
LHPTASLAQKLLQNGRRPHVQNVRRPHMTPWLGDRRPLIRLFETLRGRGYEGGYDSVRRYAKRWRQQRGSMTVQVFVPLSFAPGEAYQFDWSHEFVVLNGVTTIVKVAHLRLCHSRMLFVQAYPRRWAGAVARARPAG